MNSSKLLWLPFWPLFCLAMSSCTHDAYVLNAPNPSFFTEKGEKQLTCQGNGKSIQPQWSMSLTDNYAYQVNAHLGLLGQSYLEGLGGWYKSGKHLRFETFSGAGIGYLNYTNSTDASFVFLTGEERANVFSNYLKVPLQLNIGWKNKKGGTLFVANRISWVHFFDLDYRYYYSEDRRRDGYYLTTQTAHVDNLNGFIWEVGIGFRHRNVLFQVGASYNEIKVPAFVERYNTRYKTSINGFEEIRLEYLPVYFTAGYTFDLKRKKNDDGILEP